MVESIIMDSFFFDVVVFIAAGNCCFWSSGVVVARWRRRVDQSQGAARDRLLRALPGRGVSGLKNGAFRDGRSVSDEDDDSEAWVFETVVVVVVVAVVVVVVGPLRYCKA